MRIFPVLAVMVLAFAASAALLLAGLTWLGVAVALLGAAGMVAVARLSGPKEPPTVQPYVERESSLW